MSRIEEREQRALVGADLHARIGQARGLGAQPLHDGRFAGDDGADVAVDGVGQKRAIHVVVSWGVRAAAEWRMIRLRAGRAEPRAAQPFD